ncbi:MAG: large subunit ribosomal protein L29 [Planctomycetota bacterium]|jgi:large subunit ribosomal protein L29
MKIEEIRSKPDSELEFDMKKIERELFDLRFKASIESIASPAEISVQRRAIARIKTVLHERATGVRGAETK